MPTEQIWNSLISESKELEGNIQPDLRKKTGSYYTNFDLARQMVRDLLNELNLNNISNKVFLEPCGGTGIFIFAYLYEIQSLLLSKEKITELINNIYYCEINNNAKKFFITKFKLIVEEIFNIKLNNDYFDKHIGNALLIDISNNKPKYISLHEVFPNLSHVDIIITNPPYKNLKAESKHYDNIDDYKNDIQIYNQVKTIAKEHLSFSTEGILNIFKFFVEEILSTYTKSDSLVSLLIPSSILSDKTCTKLRKFILQKFNLKSIKIIPENVGIVDASQELAAILIDKRTQTSNISVYKDYYHYPDNKIDLSMDIIKTFSEDLNILPIDYEELQQLNKIAIYPKLKDISYIYNLRGELDLTTHKKFIINEQTNYKLIRGRNLSLYNFDPTLIKEYVKSDFLESTNKNQYIFSERIACQQIVNKNKEKRVIFSFIPKNYILANSCNFIAISQDSPVSLYFLLAIFNSDIINWYFKLTSSNNHINNYEIDNFPIPINSPYKNEISTLVETFLESHNNALLNKINDLVTKSFFPIDEKNNITSTLNEEIAKAKKNKNLFYSQNNVLNHITLKLSDLDIEMIKDIPQGGNWQDIPDEVIKKSQRLIKIKQTGGRTTLYGRLNYTKPAFTITTYFNRPGNGTYVHPIFNRVITPREAARFQSFPDDYYFYGNKKQILNQIGNAVPPLLAFQIATQIVKITKCKTSVDLFCGAGGLTLGFKMAGVKSIIANDIEKSACITLACNNPNIPIYVGDITQQDVKRHIIDIAINAKADIICGGPPCQGFSLAGFRADDDPRNQLFKDFIEIVKNVNPKIVVFENVTGLLSYKNGQTYKDILCFFKDLGYNCLGKTLDASDYSVPQKRKRVIIICTRIDQPYNPDILFPLPITTDSNNKISSYDTIADLENVNLDVNCTYNNSYESLYVQMLKHKLSATEFLSSKNIDSNTDSNKGYEQLTFDF